MAKQAAKKPEHIEEEGEHRMYKVSISGTYGNFKGEIVDFQNVEGLIPYNPSQEVAEMHVQGRYVERFLREALDEKGEPYSKPRNVFQVYIDNIEETTGTISFIGKDIKKLTLDEIQDLATMKDLRFIPLPSMRIGLRDMLIRAYVAYSEKVLKKKIKWQDASFNFAKLPAIIMDGGERVEDGPKFTNDEMIEMEMKGRKVQAEETGDNPHDRFTFEELKTLADTKQVMYEPDVTFDDLYAMLFKPS